MQDLDVVASALHALQSAGKGSGPVSPANHEAVLSRDVADPCPASPVDRLDTDDNDDTATMPQQGKQAEKALPSEVAANAHPVIRSGWRKPLCHVHCNGLVGQLLGGHDRDLYIRYVVVGGVSHHADLGTLRCTSGEYSHAPLVDVSQGGCIMTCSQFEKAAGRELSKKWKESIHVIGEGEGSKVR